MPLKPPDELLDPEELEDELDDPELDDDEDELLLELLELELLDELLPDGRGVLPPGDERINRTANIPAYWSVGVPSWISAFTSVPEVFSIQSRRAEPVAQVSSLPLPSTTGRTWVCAASRTVTCTGTTPTSIALPHFPFSTSRSVTANG